MNTSTMSNHSLPPAAFHFAIISLATLILCSCQSLSPEQMGDLSAGTRLVSATPRSPAPLRAEAAFHPTAVPAAAVITGSVDKAFHQHAPAAGPWQPPGLERPWPHDEYLRDGGDFGPPAAVKPDWTVDGLEQEDTIAHFDTLDGRTIVQPTNRVYIYAPRFGAVRRVDGLFVHEGHNVAHLLANPLRLAQRDELQTAASSLERTQPVGQRGSRASSIYRSREQGGGLEREQGLAAYEGALLPFEDFQIIRSGRYDQREKARLATAVVAAWAWSHHQAVQILIDNQQTIVDTSDQWTQVVYDIEEPTKPRLRVVKIASSASAAPGETVDFTIRFDNVGDQLIGNVTLIDNLTTRLAFVPESDKSSLPAHFAASANEGGSLRLRWEITEPLKPGEGGVVRFRCKVR